MDLAQGPGLSLGSVARDSLRFAIDGYQFADSDNPRERHSWYVLEGAATREGNEWTFRWQALTCDTPAYLALWLLQLADWIAAGSSQDAPECPWLIEPNLQFPDVRMVNGRAELTIELNREFLAPERRNGRVGAGGPEVLTVYATAEQLRRAAIDLAATAARYPEHPLASRPVVPNDVRE